MFSSNQILIVNGDIDDIEKCLTFALELKADLEWFVRKENPIVCIFQITEDGKYCIGYSSPKNIPNGWQAYPFDFDLSIIASIIKQHIEKTKVKDKTEWQCGDGTCEKGFLMENLRNGWDEQIQNISYGIVSFKPCVRFFAK